MDSIEITHKEYQDLLKRLDEISKKITYQEKASKVQWIDNSEFLQLMKISRRTAQSYRDNNMIAFAIIGNKIYYKLSDCEELLNRHYKKRLQ
jgi:hypothetical protein